MTATSKIKTIMNENNTEEETWLTITQMEENDAPDAISGTNKRLMLEKEIAAQLATLNSAQGLTNQHRQNVMQEPEISVDVGGWAYNMADLAHWVHHYTKRRKLHCKSCDAEKVFVCESCGNKAEYQDEL